MFNDLHSELKRYLQEIRDALFVLMIRIFYDFCNIFDPPIICRHTYLNILTQIETFLDDLTHVEAF